MKNLALGLAVLLGTGCGHSIMKKDPNTLEFECALKKNADAKMCRWYNSNSKAAAESRAELAKLASDSRSLFEYAYRCGYVQQTLTETNKKLRKMVRSCRDELELRENDK